MPNAAAIATGHLPGDTGAYSNALYGGFQIYNTGNFDKIFGTPTPFIENDTVLADFDDHFGGNWLGEDSLLALARAHGYGTAAVGKLGPTGLQDVTQLEPRDGKFVPLQTIVIDDATGIDPVTGADDGVPLAEELSAALRAAGLPVTAPRRVQPPGDAHVPGTGDANRIQQDYFIAATTRAVLPLLRKRGQPFALLYWSRDPDGTQHNQGDSLNALWPGVNGPTSRAGIRNADDNLRKLLAALRREPGLAANTDVFVISDHGFATISKRDIDAQHHATTSYAATQEFADVPRGFLPPGFLALDLAEHLHLPLYDPDRPYEDGAGPKFRTLRRDARANELERQHPLFGNGLIGGSGVRGPDSDPTIVVAANGGSDLIYLSKKDPPLLRQIAAFLASQDYVGALFADDDYGPIPGVLPLSAIGLHGATRLPTPALLVGFRSFQLDPKEAGGSRNALQNAVQIADTPLQQGQGIHGGWSRDNTYNFMAAAGPDFKSGFEDRAPAGNADIAPTLAAILGWSLSQHGTLTGRVLDEAGAAGRRSLPVDSCTMVSSPSADGHQTVLEYQRAADRVYVDAARFVADPHVVAGCRPRMR
jgi:arylsulfatase A-like enzyme